MKIKLLLLFFLLVLTGCTNKLEYSNLKKMSSPGHRVKLFAKEMRKLEINFCYAMGILGERSIVYDSKSDQLIKIVDMKAGKILKAFGRRGQGPGEFIHPAIIFPDMTDKNIFWVYDKQRRLLNKFDIQKVLADSFIPDELIRFSGEKKGYGYLDQILMTTDGRMIGIGLFLRDRLVVYNNNGSYIESIGRIPVRAENEDRAIHHANAFSGRMALRRKSNEIFVATQYGSIVEKYDLAGKALATFIGPDPIFPEYDIVNTGTGYSMAFNEKTRFGYLDILFNDHYDRLFILYSGKSQFYKGKSNRAWLGRTIYIVDANGVITTQIDLDKEIHHIGMAEDGAMLYGLAEEGIYEFALKSQHGNRPFLK